MTLIFNTSDWSWPQYLTAGSLLLTVLGKVLLYGQQTRWNGFSGIVDFVAAVFVLSAGGFFR